MTAPITFLRPCAVWTALTAEDAAMIDRPWHGAALGAVFAVDTDGHKHTLVTEDVAMHRAWVESGETGILGPNAYEFWHYGWPTWVAERLVR